MANPEIRSHNSNPSNQGFLGKYISATGAKNLKKYTYKGSDASLIYNHITNPYLYPWVLSHIPLWMAPNLITLLGLLCTVITYFLTAHYCPKLEGEAPPWVYILNGVFFFLYQTLDAVDGKQARRTGSSSPLGLLFDHGCDAVNTTISTLTVLSTVQLGPTWLSFSLWGGSVLGFYAATWEEYYTGELSLPVLNGPNEGIIITCLIHIFTAFVGPSWWLEESFGYPRNILFWALTMVVATLTILSNVINVIHAVRNDSKFSLPVAMTRMIPFIITITFTMVWVLDSPTDIMHRRPRLVIWALALVFNKLVTQLMIAHLCDENYHPLGKTLSILFFLGAHAFFNVFTRDIEDVSGVHFNEDTILFEFFLIALIAYLHLVISMLWEVTGILQISCFAIPKDKKM